MSKFRRLKAGLILLALLPLVACSSVPVSASEQSPWRFTGVSRVVVIPDVHGAYDALTELLKETGVVDQSLNWAGGDAHLVSLGDLLDRGADSRKVMDLFMRLEREATGQGGRVHVVAGNHELMNLIGDLRYVAPGEFAAFAAEETETMRATVNDVSKPVPPGFYAHRKAFRADGDYGKWLLALPAVVVINNVAYSHGGLGEVATQANLDELNQMYRQTVKRYLELWERLKAAGVLPDDESQDAGALAQSALANSEQSECLEERATACINAGEFSELQEFVDISRAPVLSDGGPLWTRSAVYCRSLFERPMLEAGLDNLQADSLIVGHTTAPDSRVHALHDNKLTLLDTGMLVSYYKGRPAAMVLEDGRRSVQFLSPVQTGAAVEDDYPYAYTLSRLKLLAAVKEGNIRIQDKTSADSHWKILLESHGQMLNARFYPDEQSDLGKRELAAYLLSEQLGFDIVSPAARRSAGSVKGVVQLVYPDAVSESARRNSGAGFSGWCPVSRQLQLMYAWDLLIANQGRSLDNLMYRQSLWQLFVEDHSQAFGSAKRLPRALNKDALEMDEQVYRRLTEFDEAAFNQAAMGLLSEKELRALNARRKLLVKLFRR